MSLQLILGGSGTGKSTRLYQMIIERSVQFPDEKTLLIVPEQKTMQAQKNIVMHHPRHGVMNVDVLSFERLAYRIFEELGLNQKEILEDTGKSMIIRRILTEHEEELSAFRGNIRKKGFVDEVKSMLSELLQYGVTPDILRKRSMEMGTESVLYAKLQDITVIYEAFLDRIHEKYMTTEEVPDRLCDVIEQSDMIRRVHVFLDDFTGFTPIQYRLMTRILQLAPRVVMTLNVDVAENPYQTVSMEHLFYLPKDTIFQLERICHEHQVSREADILLEDNEKGRFAGHPELAAMEKNLFRKRAAARAEKPEDLMAFRLTSPNDEMGFVAMKIHEYAARKHYRYRDMAVVASDMNLYRSSADYWFDKYQIPCFFDGRRNISGNMLVEWLRSLCSVFLQKYSYASMLRYLRSGLTGISEEETDCLEDYVLALGIRGHSKWTKVWTAKMQGMSDEELDRINGIRERLILPLEALYEVSRNKESRTVDFMRRLYLYMQQLGIRGQLEAWTAFFEKNGDLSRAKEYEQIYDVMIELLERMYLILGQEPLSIQVFSDVLDAGVNDVRIGIIPPGVDQVTFGDIRRTRLENIKVLFFVGMNDGLVPLMENGGGLLTEIERDRLALHHIHLAPTAKENTCTEQYYLYMNMTKPSEKLILTCSEQDAAGKENRPSSIFDRIKAVFPKLVLERVHQTDTEKGDLIHSYQYMIRGLREISENGQIPEDWLDVYDWFMSRPEYAEKTRQLVEAAFYRHWDEQLSQAAVRAVYGGQLTGGVTMLEKYAACAYAHFLSYGLHLKERKIYQVQAPDIGMIFHQAIERFSLRIGRSGYQWRTIPDEIRDHLVEECVSSVVLEYNHSVMQDSMRANYLTEKIMRMTKRTIWALQQQLKKGDFEPVGYEVRFTTELENQQMHLSYGDRGVMSLNGKIDRMDLCEEDDKVYLKIIDYKSGRTKFDLASVFHGLQLQLMVYMNAAREEQQQKKKQCIVIPAGILYYHIDDPFVTSDNFRDFAGNQPVGSDEQNEDYSDSSGAAEDVLSILEQLAVDGLVLDDGDAVRHMDHHPEEPPKVLPVKIKKDGTLSALSSAAAPENFEVLSWHVKRTTKRLGEKIFSGDISVHPYRYGTQKACDYCSFKSVCGFDPAFDGFDWKRLKKMNKDEIWEAIRKEAGE